MVVSEAAVEGSEIQTVLLGRCTDAVHSATAALSLKRVVMYSDVTDIHRDCDTVPDRPHDVAMQRPLHLNFPLMQANIHPNRSTIRPSSHATLIPCTWAALPENRLPEMPITSTSRMAKAPPCPVVDKICSGRKLLQVHNNNKR